MFPQNVTTLTISQEFKHLPKARRPKVVTGPTSGPVKTIRVNPKVWAEVMKAYDREGGDVIVVEGHNKVYIDHAARPRR